MGADPEPNSKPPADEQPAGTATRTDRIRTDVRERVDAIGERFEEPVRAVTNITQRTMELFPVRVWRRFLAANGFLLSAGISYQALFAVFAALYVLFAVAGIWLTGDEAVMNAFVTIVNTYVPGLIGPDGVITQEELVATASSSTSLFGYTGAIALAGFIWTAIGWMTYSRMAVRSIFGLPKDNRSYVLLKARDLLVSIIFGAALLAGSLLTVASTAALQWIFSLMGIPSDSTWMTVVISGGSFLIVFAIDALVLVTMFRFLANAEIRWSRLWGGSLLGAAVLVLLQYLAGILVGSAVSNPLLATFAVFIGLLLWFRISAIVTLVAAAWIYIRATDSNESLRRVTPAQLEAERLAAEHHALVVAAQVELRQAREELATAGWFRAPVVKRRIRLAEDELARLEASRPDAGPAGSVGRNR